MRPAAARDISHAYAWYERQKRGLGEEFIGDIRSTIGIVLENPLAFPEIFGGARRALVRHFPYGLFYRILSETIVFVACFHTRRNPALWKQRK